MKRTVSIRKTHNIGKTFTRLLASSMAAAALITASFGILPDRMPALSELSAVERVEAKNFTMADLKKIYPHNSYWNSSYHGRAWQCHGWALTCGEKLTGTDPYRWSRHTSYQEIRDYINGGRLKAGDIMRVGSNRHTILVTDVSGSDITFADCNWKRNTVLWDNHISVSQTAGKYGSGRYSGIWYIMSAPSAADNGPVNSPSSAGSDMQTRENNSSLDRILFDPDLYYALYPDLQQAIGKNSDALYHHYQTCGIPEGRIASIYFDPHFYLNCHPDLKAAFGNNFRAAYDHFKNYGLREGRKASPYFAVREYAAHNPDILRAFGNDNRMILNHFNDFVYYGDEWRRSASGCSIERYKNRYSDLRQHYGSANSRIYFRHLLTYGVKEGRSCR